MMYIYWILTTKSWSNEDLAESDQLTMEEIKSAAADDDNDDELEIHKEKGLTSNGLWEVFEKVDEIVHYFKDNDPFYNSSRFWARNKGSSFTLSDNIKWKFV